MEELVDLIAPDASPSDVSDKIKDALMGKAAERIDAFKPEVVRKPVVQKPNSVTSPRPNEGKTPSITENK